MKVKNAVRVTTTSGRRKSRILLADENVLSAGFLAHALEQNTSFQVAECVADQEGLYRALRERKPDILLSVYLPEIAVNHFRLLKPRTEAFPSIPRVVLLDRGDREVVVDAFAQELRVSSCVFSPMWKR